ncbi:MULTISPECIES: DUF3098 domain-containing protein [Spirosoma]|uniref:DUF3098 domain-containing protein n=1 Tax=Spirosoma sordidisoli TaxID=2502893 RepID=A0A4Q2UN78_9BACT|nr:MULTISPECIES: DUF3098 domain-containing protein [Spirosoma]RYC71103.1 DUF3098 domain-containing protein [Spirosoma sordidisoli]
MAKDKQLGSTTLVREEPAKKAPVVATAAPKPLTSRFGSSEPAPTAALPFGRRNYMIMLAGIGVILLGFFIMSLDKEEFGFGFLGLTLGPLVVFSGFVLEFFAILARPRS